jgi:hypothetical protein
MQIDHIKLKKIKIILKVILYYIVQFWFEYLFWFINDEVGNIKLLLFWPAILYRLYTYLTLFFI